MRRRRPIWLVTAGAGLILAVLSAFAVLTDASKMYDVATGIVNWGEDEGFDTYWQWGVSEGTLFLRHEWSDAPGQGRISLAATACCDVTRPRCPLGRPLALQFGASFRKTQTLRSASQSSRLYWISFAFHDASPVFAQFFRQRMLATPDASGSVHSNRQALSRPGNLQTAAGARPITLSRLVSACAANARVSSIVTPKYS